MLLICYKYYSDFVIHTQRRQHPTNFAVSQLYQLFLICRLETLLSQLKNVCVTRSVDISNNLLQTYTVHIVFML